MATHEENKRLIKEFVCAHEGVSEQNIASWFSEEVAGVDLRVAIDRMEVSKCLTELSALNVHAIGFVDGKYWPPEHSCAAGASL